MQTEPQQEHQWLQKLVGDWTYEADCITEPEQPRSKFKGSERVRSLGGLWVLAEGQGEMPGGGTATTMTRSAMTRRSSVLAHRDRPV